MLQTHETTGFQYDPDLVDPDFFEMLDAVPDPEEEPGGMLMGAAPEPLEMAPRATPLSQEQTDALVEEVWQDLLASEEGAAVAALSPEEQAAFKATYLAPPQTLSEDAAAMITLPKLSIAVVETEDSYEIQQDQMPMMAVPLGASRAKEKARKSAFLIAAGVCLADVVGMVMAAVGVVQALNKRSMAKGAAKLSSKYAAGIAAKGKEFKAAAKATQLASMQRTLGIAKSLTSFPKLAGVMLSEMSLLEKTGAVATAALGLSLALASGGGSVWLSVLAMTASVAVFVIDLVIARDKYVAWKG